LPGLERTAALASAPTVGANRARLPTRPTARCSLFFLLAPAGAAPRTPAPAGAARRASAGRSGDGGLAEERLHLGVEVGHRAHAVAGPELEHARPVRGLEREHHLRRAWEAADDTRQLAHDPGRRRARVQLEPHLLGSAIRLELAHFERDQLRLALLVVDPALDDQDPVRLEQLAAGGV